MKTHRRMLVQADSLGLLTVVLSATDCWAVRSYTPVHPDHPKAEARMWQIDTERWASTYQVLLNSDLGKNRCQRN